MDFCVFACLRFHVSVVCCGLRFVCVLACGVCACVHHVVFRWRWVAWEGDSGSLRWTQDKIAPRGWMAAAERYGMSPDEATTVLNDWRTSIKVNTVVDAQVSEITRLLCAFCMTCASGMTSAGGSQIHVFVVLFVFVLLFVRLWLCFPTGHPPQVV